MDTQFDQAAAWLIQSQKGFERIVIVGMVGMDHPLGSVSFKYREIGILVYGFRFQDVLAEIPASAPCFERSG